MPAFYIPENGSFSDTLEYLMPLGLGMSTIEGNIIYNDAPLTRVQLERIELAGFTRADTHWYTIEPEPDLSEHGPIKRAAGVRYASTIPPMLDEEGKLRVSFIQAISDEGLRSLKGLGYTVTKVPMPKTPSIII